MAALPIGQVDSGGRSHEVKWDKDTKEVSVVAPGRKFAFNIAQKKAATPGAALEVAQEVLRDNGPWAHKVPDLEPADTSQPPMNRKNMRDREEILKDVSDARKSEKASALMQEHIVEVLLDIRDLLAKHPKG
jgi:hypothetical protein